MIWGYTGRQPSMAQRLLSPKDLCEPSSWGHARHPITIPVWYVLHIDPFKSNFVQKVSGLQPTFLAPRQVCRRQHTAEE